jgi:Ca-activated chloride channel family protein
MATFISSSRHKSLFWLCFMALAVPFLTSTTASGQGLLVNVEMDMRMRLPRPIIGPHPVPPHQDTYKIKELDVHVQLKEQVARVQVSQSFVNTGSRQMEVSFVFPLPYEGAIEQLTLLVDGKEFPARLMEKDKARKIYEEIVRKNRDPALLEWLGTGMFQTSVFPVPPGAERKVTLRYSQLCRFDRGMTEFLFPLATAKYTSHPVEKVNIQVAIESSSDIKSIYSPTHSIDFKREQGHATATYKVENQVPNSDFRLFYDVGQGKLSTRVLSYRPDPKQDGYFLLLASPEMPAKADQQPAKTVVFVVDRSGSMSGTKIDQAKEALKFVLNNLREGDLFNVIAYDDRVESFRPELQRFNNETRQQALGFVNGIYAGGSTNIDGALSLALGQLKDSQRPNYVLFLTDGLPTAGETNEMKIVANAKSHNQVRARIVAFGVGYDVNSRLLDKMVRENFGQSEYVRPNENIEQRVSALFNKIESPVMTDVALKFSLDQVRTEDGAPVNRTYPKDAYDLFAGDQLVVLGRYRQAGAAKVTVTGNVGGKSQGFDFPAELVAESKDETHAFIEKLWAVRRVGEIIDQLDLKGQNSELVKELVELSTRHGILTPYTSFLADETTKLGDLSSNARETDRRLKLLEQADGVAGFSQRKEKAAFQSAAQAPMAGAGGAATFREAGSDKQVTVDSLRNVGNKSFYNRRGQWVDSTLNDEQIKNAKRVKQFSDEYFRLAEKNGRKLSQYLAFDEPVLVNLEGESWLIEPQTD